MAEVLERDGKHGTGVKSITVTSSAFLFSHISGDNAGNLSARASSWPLPTPIYHIIATWTSQAAAEYSVTGSPAAKLF